MITKDKHLLLKKKRSEHKRAYKHLHKNIEKGIKEDIISDVQSEISGIKQQIYEDIADELYRILIMNGFSAVAAARISQQFKFRMRLHKGVDTKLRGAEPIGNMIGQYYYGQDMYYGTELENLSRYQFKPAHEPYNPRNDQRPIIRLPNKEIELVNCPQCGKPSLQMQNQLDETPGEKLYRCINCGFQFSWSDLVDTGVLAEFETILMANNQGSPESYPQWSPKSFKKDIDMDFKEYVGFDYTKAVDESVEYIESKEYEKLLTRWFSDLEAEEIQSIKRAVKTGIKQGLSLKEIKKKINNIIRDDDRAEVIARTETVRVANEGELKRLDKEGVKKVKWISAPEDGRLCKDCEKKGGKEYNLDDVKGQIPLHPNCRCHLREIPKYI